MTMFDVTVDASDVEEKLKAFEKRAGDLSPTMAIIAEMLVSGVNDEFDSEGQGDWPALALSTRRRGGATTKILQNLGVFAGSIRPDSDQDSADASTGVDYAVHHVFGAPKAHIPQRNPFEIDETIFDDAVELILERIVG